MNEYISLSAFHFSLYNSHFSFDLFSLSFNSLNICSSFSLLPIVVDLSDKRLSVWSWSLFIFSILRPISYTLVDFNTECENFRSLSQNDFKISKNQGSLKLPTCHSIFSLILWVSFKVKVSMLSIGWSLFIFLKELYWKVFVIHDF